jgi:hypothetical protein
LRLLTKTSSVPSGDHAGAESTPSSSVILCWSVPSAFITQMSNWRVNAIRVPSGDHAGSVSARRLVVRRRWSLPSGSAV